MVRVNLIPPKNLSDQHLVAEYDEILMLLGYVKRYPEIRIKKDKLTKKEISEIPQNYTLNRGHMLFFKDKLLYLKKRHELLKSEMRKRGFATNITISLDEFPNNLKNNWTPKEKDFKIIKDRIAEKINKKPEYYRYYGKYRGEDFFLELLKY